MLAVYIMLHLRKCSQHSSEIMKWLGQGCISKQEWRRTCRKDQAHSSTQHCLPVPKQWSQLVNHIAILEKQASLQTLLNKTKKQFLLFPRFLDSYAGCFPQGKFVDRFVRKSGNCDSSPGFYINSCVTSGSLFSEVEPISNVPFSFKLYDSTLKNKTFANSL